MSTFTMRGRFMGQSAEITWTDGALSGEPRLVSHVRMLAALSDGSVVSSPTGSTTTNHLHNSASAAMLMTMAFADRPTTTYSDIEPVEPPKGVVM